MHSSLIVLVLFAYFVLLMVVARITGRQATDNDTFFTARHSSPWWVVAIGMVGASISGVSFVSVPGMVGSISFTYMQTVIGFFFGYLIIAKVLLPLYYRLQLTSIYSYLGQRFGERSYTTGASFFLLSKTVGAAARLYVVAFILQVMVFDAMKVPFWLTISGILLMIWLYTFRSGIKSIVWTDSLQTLIMIVALVAMVVKLMQLNELGVGEMAGELYASTQSRVFVFDDWISKQHFVKQFFSGIFIAVVMTGLDQDMMQKNLSCRNLPEAQKNMYWYGIAFIPVNLLFLILGWLMLNYASSAGLTLPTAGDALLPFYAQQVFGTGLMLLFMIGLIAAAFSSADSALAALTTSFMVDILKVDKTDGRKGLRMSIHAGLTALFVVIVLAIRHFNDRSIIDTIYVLVSYTYGPLLGMFAFGLFTGLKPNDRWVPYLAVASPVVCFISNELSIRYLGYAFGYELLLLNGLLMAAGLYISSKKSYGN
ncbi:MAG: sodium:solute symporter [Paludibacter sp.]|nr:sodium:solute symporter [Paludibacter sp.]